VALHQPVISPTPPSPRSPQSTDVDPRSRVCRFIPASTHPQGFLASRLLEQALRHRLLKDASGVQSEKTKLRRMPLKDLIERFVEAGHATGDIHELVELLGGFRNFAAHPPQPKDVDSLDIDQAQASFLLNAAAHLLDHIYVRPARLAQMKE